MQMMLRTRTNQTFYQVEYDEIDWHKERRYSRPIHRQTDTWTDRQTDRQTKGQTETEIKVKKFCNLNKQKKHQMS